MKKQFYFKQSTAFDVIAGALSSIFSYIPLIIRFFLLLLCGLPLLLHRFFFSSLFFFFKNIFEHYTRSIRLLELYLYQLIEPTSTNMQKKRVSFCFVVLQIVCSVCCTEAYVVCAQLYNVCTSLATVDPLSTSTRLN